jgi:hypothetical protein
MLLTRRRAVHLFAALVLASLALSVAGCGDSSDPSDSTNAVENESVGNQTVKLEGLQFKITGADYLDSNDKKDSAYLKGQRPVPKGSSYFGIFFNVKNMNKVRRELPPSIFVTDAKGRIHDSLFSESSYALPLGEWLEPAEKVPSGSASKGPYGGLMAIFMLPVDASLERPLTLHLPGFKGETATLKVDF